MEAGLTPFASSLLRDTDVVDILLARRTPPLRWGVWCHSQECHNQESEAEDRHSHYCCKDLLHYGDSFSHISCMFPLQDCLRRCSLSATCVPSRYATDSPREVFLSIEKTRVYRIITGWWADA